MQNRNYRSPFTGLSVNVEKYFEEWDSLILPLEAKYGLVVTSYDSDIVASREVNKGTPHFYNESVRLPVWFVKQLIEVK